MPRIRPISSSDFGSSVAGQPVAKVEDLLLALGQLGDGVVERAFGQLDLDLLVGRPLVARERDRRTTPSRPRRPACRAMRPRAPRCEPRAPASAAASLRRRAPRRSVRRSSFATSVALRPRDPLLALDDVHGDADRARLVRDAALHRLADPPRRVRRELESLPPVELLGGADQPDDPLLDQVEQRQAVPLVALRDRDDEPQVRVDEQILRRLVADLDRASRAPPPARR